MTGTDNPIWTHPEPAVEETESHLCSVELAPDQPLRMIMRDVALKRYLKTINKIGHSGAVLDMIRAVM